MNDGREFLYPTSTQFPVDRVCADIVHALEARNFDVPGIDVRFNAGGSGEQRFRYVSKIQGENFALKFGRKQRTLPGGVWNDIAAVTGLVVGKRHLHIYEDESGPTFWTYVGDDWDGDREWWMRTDYPGTNSKLRADRRRYLLYKGSIRPDRYGHHYRGQRPQYLVTCNDLDREYDPEDDEPRVFNTDEVLGEFRDYLEREVLPTILAFPEQERLNLWPAPEPILMPEIGDLFCYGDGRDLHRIREGKADHQALIPAHRAVMPGSCWRLCSLETPNDGTFSELAYRGFVWCGVGEPGPRPGRYAGLIRVQPNRANDIYVIDQSAYDGRRAELSAAMEDDRHTFTSEEVADFTRARARTLTPIHEYDGGFAKPIVLIGRELGFDEVAIVESGEG